MQIASLEQLKQPSIVHLIHFLLALYSSKDMYIKYVD